jgi:dTDP-4-amino-4,6-dideoxygalactose transaminase
VIARLGARPVFVDLDSNTFNLNSARVAEKITYRTKAIMPVHLFGRCAEMDPILAAAEIHGIAVIEDAAEALGARDEKERRAGTIGLIGCFSFFPTKNLGGFGDGGMTVTNNARMGETLQMLRVHGSKPKYFHPIVGGKFPAGCAAGSRVAGKIAASEEMDRGATGKCSTVFDTV